MKEQVTSEQTNNEYIDAITKLKETTVSKDLYNKLKEENKKLLDSIVNGSDVDVPKNKPEKPDIKALYDKLMDADHPLDNYEYMKTFMEIKNAVQEEHGVDPTVPVGRKFSPEAADLIELQQANDTFSEILSNCEDNRDFMDALDDCMPGVYDKRKIRKK